MTARTSYIMLPARGDCTRCALHECAKSRGLALRPWDGAPTYPNREKCVVVLGKAPGVSEDEDGKTFTGVTGFYTNELYVRGSKIDQFADVWLGNTVRCRLPNPQMAVPKSAMGACKAWLEEDLGELAKHYREIVILATGSEAVQLVLGKNCALGSFPQGKLVEFCGQSVRVFATYLAAALLPGRDPSKASAVEVHLEMLREYLETGHLEMEVSLDRADRVSRIPADANLVALDIETYGACADLPPQRVFHPIKSLAWDNVSRANLVQTVACAWRDPKTHELKHRVYMVQNNTELEELLEDLAGLKTQWILGQNVTFDIMYLRAYDDRFAKALQRFGPHLVELSVFNFLDSDQRPERSLKSLSPLLRTYNYQIDEVDLRKGDRYKNCCDERLWRYNAVDAIATLRNYEILRNRIAQKFGSDSAKLSARTLTWYSDLLWLAIGMSEDGIQYDTQRLGRLHNKLTRKLLRISALSKARFGGIVAGEGTKAYQEDLAVRAAKDLGLVGDSRLMLTDVHKCVSSGEENLNLFLGCAKSGTSLRLELRLLKRWRQVAKVIATYTRPMLGIERDKKCSEKEVVKDLNNRLVNGRAHPSWYIVPSHVSGGSAEESGGTQQARITSKGPAVQTQPHEIESCQCSRYPGGAILSVDESQLELRVAAMASHDPAMIHDYMVGVQRHASTASLIAGHAVTKKEFPALYHAGKTLNFLTLFNGGARTFQETVQREVGLDIPLARCRQIIAEFDRKHSGFRAWQRTLIDSAKARGYVELPVLGVTRTFLGSPEVIDETYVPHIVNFPIQSTAALLTLSAQVESAKRFAGSPVLCVSNTYDEGRYDVPAELVESARGLLVDLYKRPPIYDELISAGFYPLALDCEVSLAYN